MEAELTSQKKPTGMNCELQFIPAPCPLLSTCQATCYLEFYCHFSHNLEMFSASKNVLLKSQSPWAVPQLLQEASPSAPPPPGFSTWCTPLNLSLQALLCLILWGSCSLLVITVEAWNGESVWWTGVDLPFLLPVLSSIGKNTWNFLCCTNPFYSLFPSPTFGTCLGLIDWSLSDWFLEATWLNLSQ